MIETIECLASSGSDIPICLIWIETGEPKHIHEHRGRVAALTPEEVFGLWCRQVLDITLPELLEWRVQGGYDGTLDACLDVVREVGDGLLIIFPDTDGRSIVLIARPEG